MNWTKEKPSKAGWYWYKEAVDIVVIVQVAKSPAGDYLNVSVWLPNVGGAMHALEALHGEWAGPLEPPTDNPFAHIKPGPAGRIT